MVKLDTIPQKEFNKRIKTILSCFPKQWSLDGQVFAESIIEFDLEDYIDDMDRYIIEKEKLFDEKMKDMNAVLYNYVFDSILSNYEGLEELCELVTVFGNYLDTCFDCSYDDRPKVLEILQKNIPEEDLKDDPLVKFFLYHLDLKI